MDEVIALYDHDGADPSKAIVLTEASGPGIFRVTVGSGCGVRVLWGLDVRPPRAYPPLIRTELVEKS